jgi:glycerol-3-phosphate acyltransferase PlsY
MATEHTFTALAEGTHTLDVEAIDEANNSVSATVTFFVDVSLPVVTITAPTGNATFATNVSSLSFSGTGSDNIGVVEVTWTNSQGGSGVATISGSTWSIPAIALLEGNNVITISARDASNNTAVSTLTVTYTPDSVEKAASPGLDVGMVSILVVLVIVVVLAALFFARRRKK